MTTKGSANNMENEFFKTVCLNGKERHPAWRLMKIVANKNMKNAVSPTDLFNKPEDKELLEDQILTDVLFPFFKAPFTTGSKSDENGECMKAMGAAFDIFIQPRDGKGYLCNMLDAGVMAGRPRGRLLPDDFGIPETVQRLYEHCFFDVRDLLETPLLLGRSLAHLGDLREQTGKDRVAGLAIAYRLGFDEYEMWANGNPSRDSMVTTVGADMLIERFEAIELLGLATFEVSQDMFANVLTNGLTLKADANSALSSMPISR